MRYLVLCCDYDGTLAHDGGVPEETISALEKVRASGRKVLLVTGRELPDLRTVFNRLDLFDYIVAENGALLYHPETNVEKLLAETPSEKFINVLKAHGATPLSIGKVIVATREPFETVVLDTIRDMGLELQVIFNKGAVMILPPGVNKASGLIAALKEMNLSPHSAVGIGDAENDHALLNTCECGVAVANALPSLMETADFVTQAARGEGVSELIEELLKNDLSERRPRPRYELILGKDEADNEVVLPTYGSSTLIVGTSGSGKSTVATGLLERLTNGGYSYCVIDPEGDYDTLENAVRVGSPDHAPTIDEVMQVVCKAETNVVINLVGFPLSDRPAFFQALLPHLQDLRARTGHPHWFVVDETHHVLPAGHLDVDEKQLAGNKFSSVLMISVHPNMIAQPVLTSVATVIAVGKEPEKMLKEFSASVGEKVPLVKATTLESGQVLIWQRAEGKEPKLVTTTPSQTERRRHIRKYSEGELPEDRSFYFRGPQGKLHLRAQNLILFLQMAEGVDDDTWLYHVERGDVSDWIENMVKDRDLAEEIRGIEQRLTEDHDPSRVEIRAAIEKNYTLPAGAA